MIKHDFFKFLSLLLISVNLLYIILAHNYCLLVSPSRTVKCPVSVQPSGAVISDLSLSCASPAVVCTWLVWTQLMEDNTEADIRGVRPIVIVQLGVG